MKLSKFRIRDYKSIIDSGDCFPTESITILAGKNEAGKSSILEALSEFNTGTPINEKALPIVNASLRPSIEITLGFDKNDWREIIKKTNLDEAVSNEVKEFLQSINSLTIKKEYPSSYKMSPELEEATKKWFNQQDKKLKDSLALALTASLVSQPTSTSELVTRVASIITASSRHNTTKQALSYIQSGLDKIPGSPSTTELQLTRNELTKIQSEVDTLIASKQALDLQLSNAVLGYCPNFILFSSFEDVFPSEIPFGQLESNTWIQDLAKISDLNIEVLQGTNSAIKKQHKHKLNSKLNLDFQQYWTQDYSNLSVDWDSSTLNFWIEENGNFYPPDMRSQGRRWHLAFYVKVSARVRANAANILLIDEPGLYLHATAQRDILKHLEDSGRSNQIIFSTHSPYLIEPDKIDRIRLVIKLDKTGSMVENKIHAVADKETLTPILSAIGLEINQGIVNANLVQNVVVEGPSDYFYLTALAHYLQIEHIKFVSGGGAGNMPKVGTILQGWGAKIIYLFDNDRAFQNARGTIKRDWATISPDWLKCLDLDGSIEDLFEREDFAKILKCSSESIKSKNSDHMKKEKLDKVLPAKQFLDSARSIKPTELSEATSIRAKALFDDLTARFANYSS